jgi:hypothetical protein
MIYVVVKINEGTRMSDGRFTFTIVNYLQIQGGTK